MIWVILIALVWIACGVGGYLLLKRSWRKEFPYWTVGVRRKVLLMSCFGPASLLTGILMNVEDSNTPASW